MEGSKKLSATSNDIPKAEAGPGMTIECKRIPQPVSTSNWSAPDSPVTESGAQSTGSCPPTPVYFEMVNPSHPSHAERAVVVVFGEDEIVEFELVESSRATGSSKGVVKKELDQEEIDTLDGELLPNFFSYTREEREWIRGAGCREGAGPRPEPKTVVRNLDEPQEQKLEEEEEEEDFSHLWSYKI